MAHTENMIVVYVSDEEKEQIRDLAKKYRKSMSRYLLDLHLFRVNRNLGPYEPPRPKNHHPMG